MILYGTLTSPYVRRVRIVAKAVGAPLELLDTSTEDGQRSLREVSPVWKIPVLRDGTQDVFDSRVINEYLISKHGLGSLLSRNDSPAWSNFLTVIDGALDSAINAFYLKKSKVDVEKIGYVEKQQQRVKSAMSWLEEQCKDSACSDGPEFGIAEVALVTTLEWMTFRNVYPVEDHPALSSLQKQFADHSAFLETKPM